MSQEEQKAVTIKPLKDGPYLVEGVVYLTDADGETKEYTNPHLCRCGGSAKKPFCDGTHRKIGFKG